MFMDYRERAKRVTEQVLNGTTDWRDIDLLLDIAKQYRVNKPDARFALLRVWSHSHFWPLMVGYDKKQEVSFEDPQSRIWRWKFYSEEVGGDLTAAYWLRAL